MSLVSIEDGIKAAEEYAPARKVRVELSFDVPEGGDPQKELDLVAALANAKVNELLGRSGRSGSRAVATLSGPAAVAEQPKPLSDKDKLAQQAGVLETTPAPKPRAPRAPKKVEEPKPAQIDLEELTGAPEPVKPKDELDELLEAPAKVEEVTDDALNKAVQQKNAEISAPQKIRALVAEFNPDPAKAFTLREIPQQRRAEFLEKLKALKA